MDSLIIRRLIERQIPYLNVILDEHSGKAGLFTRLEAFVDIIRWRSDNHQDYISSYGYNVGTCQRNAGTSGSRGDCAALVLENIIFGSASFTGICLFAF